MIDWEEDRPKVLTDKAFGLTFALMFGVASLALWYFFDIKQYYLPVVSIVLLSLVLIKASVLRPLNSLWSAVAMRIAAVNNFLIMFLLYSVVVLPIGLVFKLIRRDLLKTDGRAQESKSYFQTVSRQTNRDTLQDTF
jgi:hypothetical protein